MRPMISVATAADRRLYQIMKRYLERVLAEIPPEDGVLASVRTAVAESMREGVGRQRGVSGIVEAKVWEIEVLAWMTVGVSGRELELAQAIVEGSVAVGEGVPSKAPAAGEVICGAPALAAPQAVAGASAEEAVAVRVVAAAVGGAGKGLS